MTVKYAGKIIDGKPSFLEPITLPENADITILIDLTLESAPETLTPTQQAAMKFLAAIEEVNKDGFSTEDKEAFDKWDKGEYRLKFDRRLDV